MSKRSRRKRREEREKQDRWKFFEESRNDNKYKHDDFPYQMITFSMDAYQKLYSYCVCAKGEISGFGKIVLMEDRIFVDDILIFKQEASGGGTTLEAEALASFMHDLIAQGKDHSKYKLWWHTHDDFGVYWSSIDTDTIDRISKESLLVSTCMNKDGNIIGRVDELGFTSYLPVSILPAPQVLDACKKEIKEKVVPTKFSKLYGKGSNKWDGKGTQILINGRWISYAEYLKATRYNKCEPTRRDKDNAGRSWSDRKLLGDYANKDGNHGP